MSFVDPYFDETIGELRNLLGAKSSQELHELEPQIVFANELELDSIDIPRTNDLAELLNIHASNYIFQELAKENGLRGLTKDEFIKRFVYFYDQLNYIHPFREGNGRAQRVFWGRVAKDAGYEFDWDLVIGDENDEASKLASENMDLSMLGLMFTRITKVI